MLNSNQFNDSEKILLKCPVCNIHNEKKLFLNFGWNEQEYWLYECHDCDTFFYNPVPNLDYRGSHTSSDVPLRNYVESDANIQILAENILRSIPSTGATSIVDVGCGYGFSLDFAKRVLNLETFGYEPSYYGRAGAKELGLTILDSYIDKDTKPERKASVVISSEVIEHCGDPHAFIEAMESQLDTEKPGILTISTPNKAHLTKDLQNPQNLAILSPGAHIILFSKRSLELLLRQHGYSHIHFYEVGSSISAVAAKQFVEFRSAQDALELCKKYYRLALADLSPGGTAYTGFLYRLYRACIDQGDYDSAEQIFIQYQFPRFPSIQEIQSIQNFDDFSNVTVICMPLLAYYRAMHLLNGIGDHQTAANYFNLSYSLCRKKLDVAPSVAVGEYALLWWAKFHAALASYYSKDNETASKLLRDIPMVRQGHSEEGAENNPPVSSDLEIRIAELRGWIDNSEVSTLPTPKPKSSFMDKILNRLRSR